MSRRRTSRSAVARAFVVRRERGLVPLLAVRHVVEAPLRGSQLSIPGAKQGLEASIATVALLIKRDVSGGVPGHRNDGPSLARSTGSPSAATWRSASLLFGLSADECLRRRFADGTTRPERRTTHPRDDGTFVDVEAPRRRPRRKRTSINRAIFAFGLGRLASTDEKTPPALDERTSLGGHGAFLRRTPRLRVNHAWIGFCQRPSPSSSSLCLRRTPPWSSSSLSSPCRAALNTCVFN